MTQKKKERLRQKWKRWLRRIQRDLADLLISNDIFKGLRDIVNANSQIQSPATIHKWVVVNYAERVAVGTRRFIDTDERSVSLYRLIEDIAKNPEAISRNWYVSQYSRRMRVTGAADSDFEQFANKGESVVNPHGLRQDMARLKHSTKRMKCFVDKWVAHCDLNQEQYTRPTFDDVDSALDDIDKLFCKYYMLLTRNGLMTCKPALAFDWQEPLRYAWIPDQRGSG